MMSNAATDIPELTPLQRARQRVYGLVSMILRKPKYNPSKEARWLLGVMRQYPEEYQAYLDSLAYQMFLAELKHLGSSLNMQAHHAAMRLSKFDPTTFGARRDKASIYTTQHWHVNLDNDRLCTGQMRGPDWDFVAKHYRMREHANAKKRKLAEVLREQCGEQRMDEAMDELDYLRLYASIIGAEVE